MMLDQPGRGVRVSGELYQVSLEQIAKLDTLESVGLPGNTRCPITIESLEGGARTEADAFFKGAELAQPAHSGWLAIYLLDPRFPTEMILPGSGGNRRA